MSDNKEDNKKVTELPVVKSIADTTYARLQLK